MIGIIVAMESELDGILPLVKNLEIEKEYNFTFYKGNIGDKEVVISLSGIGKAASAITTTVLINRYHPELIINEGIGGGKKDYLNVGDVVIADKLTYHDWHVGSIDNVTVAGFDSNDYVFTLDSDLASFARDILQDVCQGQVYVGPIVSGDVFVTRKEVEPIIKYYDEALVVDMESCSVAHACSLFDTKCLIVRAISDVTTKEASNVTYAQFKDIVSKLVGSFIKEFIEKY